MATEQSQPDVTNVEARTKVEKSSMGMLHTETESKTVAMNSHDGEQEKAVSHAETTESRVEEINNADQGLNNPSEQRIAGIKQSMNDSPKGSENKDSNIDIASSDVAKCKDIPGDQTFQVHDRNTPDQSDQTVTDPKEPLRDTAETTCYESGSTEDHSTATDSEVIDDTVEKIGTTSIQFEPKLDEGLRLRKVTLTSGSLNGDNDSSLQDAPEATAKEPEVQGDATGGAPPAEHAQNQGSHEVSEVLVQLQESLDDWQVCGMVVLALFVLIVLLRCMFPLNAICYVLLYYSCLIIFGYPLVLCMARYKVSRSIMWLIAAVFCVTFSVFFYRCRPTITWLTEISELF